MTDYRFPSPGLDARFVVPGVDAYFPSAGAQTRFISGVDRRFTAPGFASDALVDIYFRNNIALINGLPRTIAGTTTPENYSVVGTFTRASAADWLNSAGDGLETQAASNALRREAVRGALIEEAVTAQAYNSIFAGAVAGSPGTLPTNWTVNIPAGTTRTIALGTTNNIPWIDITLTGTVTTAAQFQVVFAANNAVAALTGETWSGSAFAAVTQGLGVIPNPLFTMAERNAGLTGLVFDSTGSVNGVFSRRTKTRLLNQATTAFVTWFFTTDSVPLSTDLTATPFTIRIGLPMLNQGQLTSPIQTTNSGTVTRAADVLSVPLAMGSSGTIVVIANENIETSFGRYVQLDDGTDPNRLVLSRGNADGNLFFGSAGTGTGSISPAGALGRKAIAAAYGPNDLALSVNGGAVTTSGTHTAPSSLSTLRLNQASGAAQLRGFIERIIVFPTRLNNATLQSYSTLATWGG